MFVDEGPLPSAVSRNPFPQRVNFGHARGTRAMHFVAVALTFAGVHSEPKE